MSGTLISVKEARKLLGVGAERLTDSQVESLIVQLDFMATLAVRDYRRRKINAEELTDGS